MMSSVSIGAKIAYNQDTGVFTRIVKSGNCRAGSEVGSIKSNGYMYISIDGKYQLAHRLAWMMVTGSEPNDDIDHVNGIRSDNRFANLRTATRGENMQNERAARSSNKSSGLLGVSWSKAAGKWAAGIKLNGKKRHLGLFTDQQAAHEAYLVAKRDLHPFCTI